MTGALATDLYELNMAASYLRREMVGPATFSLFVRNLPPGRGFLVASGLEDCLAFLERFCFDEDELAWLGGTLGFDQPALDAFRRLRFTGEVWAVPEGRVVFAGEPLLEVTAPIAEAQLVETVLLNQVTFHTAVASRSTSPSGAPTASTRPWRLLAPRRSSGLWPPATSRRPAGSACGRPGPWRTRSSRRSVTSGRPSGRSPRTTPTAAPSWLTPTTPWAGSAPRSM